MNFTELAEKLKNKPDWTYVDRKDMRHLKLFFQAALVMREALENLDTWQGKQMCNASVYEIEDDEFAHAQCTIHYALAKADKICGGEK